MNALLAAFANRSIKTKLALAFGTIIAIELCVGATTFGSLTRIQQTQFSARRAISIIDSTKIIWINVLKQESDVRGFLLTSDRGFLERARQDDVSLTAALDALNALTAQQASQQVRLGKLSKLIDNWRAQIALGSLETRRPDTAPAFGAEGALGRILRNLEEIDAEEHQADAEGIKFRAKVFAAAYTLNSWGPLAALLVAAALGWILHRLFARPVAKLTVAMRRLSEGDTGMGIPYTELHDEIGAMSRALVVFQRAIQENNLGRLESEQREMHRLADLEREAFICRTADSFEAVVGSIVDAVSESALQVQTSAENLLSLADWTNREIQDVATSTKQASVTMQSLAGEADTFSASVGKINDRMERSTNVARQAIAESDHTTATIEELSQSTKQIATVVNAINAIAAQTNLLALNATIEAARAGDAGRGFAIVAGEVKTLASRTAEATIDIRHRIESMHRAADNAVTAIDRIGHTISEVATVTADMHGALEQQGGITRTMTQDTRSTAQMTAAVSQQLDRVSDRTLMTGAAATDLLASANALARQSAILHDEARRFVGSVRTG